MPARLLFKSVRFYLTACRFLTVAAIAIVGARTLLVSSVVLLTTVGRTSYGVIPCMRPNRVKTLFLPRPLVPTVTIMHPIAAMSATA